VSSMDQNLAGGLLDSVATLLPDGLLVVDRNYSIVLWNAAMERTSGLRSTDLLGKQVFAVFPFLVDTGEDQVLRDVLEGRSASSRDRPFRFESTRRSGFYDAHYTPWRGKSNEILGCLAVIRDITDAKASSLQFRETELRFKSMADVAPVLLWMSGLDGLCTFFNQTWLEFTGRSMEEEWGVGWAEGVHFEDFQRCMDTYAKAFNERAIFEMEYRLRRHDGAYRWILDRGRPRHLPDGTFAGFIGSCVDITELKHLESDLRRAVRGRDEFLSIASHELRTPIAALRLHLENLCRTIEKTADIRDELRSRLDRHAHGSLDKTTYLTTMVNTLLDVSLLSDGRLRIEREPFDLAGVVRSVVERFGDAAAHAQCTLRVAIEHDLVGRWDRVRVEQVVTNLLSNALKYGAGQPVDITASRVGEGDGVRLVVTDHGIGIKREDQPFVFDRFSRFVSARNYGGFGLGLWISREIVAAHGGRIELDSTPGAGASFAVVLPGARDQRSDRPAVATRGA
jgi:PAS domain S-box-containing protein